MCCNIQKYTIHSVLCLLKHSHTFRAPLIRSLVVVATTTTTASTHPFLAATRTAAAAAVRRPPPPERKSADTHSISVGALLFLCVCVFFFFCISACTQTYINRYSVANKIKCFFLCSGFFLVVDSRRRGHGSLGYICAFFFSLRSCVKRVRSFRRVRVWVYSWLSVEAEAVVLHTPLLLVLLVSLCIRNLLNVSQRRCCQQTVIEWIHDLQLTGERERGCEPAIKNPYTSILCHTKGKRLADFLP